MTIENETDEILTEAEAGKESESGKETLVIRLDDFETAGVTSKNWQALHELTEEQITACYDWLEEVPAEGALQAALEEWRAAAPKFIRFTGEEQAATEEQPAREVIEFVLEESIERKVKRLETWKKKTEEAEISVRDQGVRVLSLKSKVDEAKAEHKAATERWEQLVCVLQQVITDAKSGQQELPFPDDGQQVTECVIDGTNEVLRDYPIDFLSQKRICEIVGAEVIERQKNLDDPIGLTETQLDKLESACESPTIAGLEKWIAADAQWHRKIQGFGDKAINRVVSTLVAFRRVNPMDQ